MSRSPSQRGTSVLPLVQALKQNPDAWNLLPPSLWKYLEDPIDVSGWYPERDYWVLLEALIKTIDPASVDGNAWRYFARFSVEWDIGGRGPTGSSRKPQASSGVYRDFAVVRDPASFFRLASRLWSEYHDTGRVEVVGGSVGQNAVMVRLFEFFIPIEGFVRLQGYYLEEYARLVGLGLSATVTHSTAQGDPLCEWSCVLARTPAAEAYVASLPPAPTGSGVTR